MTQFISNNYEKKTSFEIVSNFIEFKSKSFEPIPNSHESVSISNEHVSNFNESVSIFNELRNIKEKNIYILFYRNHIKLSSLYDAVESPSLTRKLIARCTCIVLLSMDVLCRVDVN